MKFFRCLVVIAFVGLTYGCDDLDTGSSGGSGSKKPVVIYVEDHTSSSWPIHQATNTWNAVLNADIRYAACPPKAGFCITVTEAPIPKDREGGRILGQTQGHKVVMNGDLTETPKMALAGACHELGHALGLGHNEDSDSCMNTDVSPVKTPGTPGKRDIAELNRKLK